jgi:hypothetical protein
MGHFRAIDTARRTTCKRLRPTSATPQSSQPERYSLDIANCRCLGRATGSVPFPMHLFQALYSLGKVVAIQHILKLAATFSRRFLEAAKIMLQIN